MVEDRVRGGLAGEVLQIHRFNGSWVGILRGKHRPIQVCRCGGFGLRSEREVGGENSVPGWRLWPLIMEPEAT
jgi:hypothetical protein